MVHASDQKIDKYTDRLKQGGCRRAYLHTYNTRSKHVCVAQYVICCSSAISRTTLHVVSARRPAGIMLRLVLSAALSYRCALSQMVVAASTQTHEFRLEPTYKT